MNVNAQMIQITKNMVTLVVPMPAEGILLKYVVQDIMVACMQRDCKYLLRNVNPFIISILVPLMEHSLSGQSGVSAVKVASAPGTDHVVALLHCMVEQSVKATLQKRIHCVGEEIVVLTPLTTLDVSKRTQETIQTTRP